MPFSERAKTIALAIVKIFETSKPFGDYSAVAVLDDGAGISYGVSQFTHKSGSLYAVLSRFVDLGGELPEIVRQAMDDFRSKVKILARSNDKTVKTALKNLGKDALLQRAQREIAFENYLNPALQACDGSNFVLPLSLAVVYDSFNHGSYAKIRDKVQLSLPASIKPIQFEKEWISQYVAHRDEWLESVPRLAKTDYRTDFFLAQIGRGNWDLSLPLNVHGFKLTEEILFPNSISAPVPAISEPIGLSDKGINKTADQSEGQAPSSDITETKTTDIAQQGGMTTAVETTTPGGDAPDVPPTRVSINGPLAKWLTSGGISAVGLFAWNYVQTNPSAVGIAVICVTLLVVVIIFRGAITDAIRMQTAADPSKKNVT